MAKSEGNISTTLRWQSRTSCACLILKQLSFLAHSFYSFCLTTKTKGVPIGTPFVLAESEGFAPHGFALLSRLGSKRWVSTFCRQPSFLYLLLGCRFLPVRIPLSLSSSKKEPSKDDSFLLAESEGFEPPWACTQTVFKTASL